MLKKKIQQPCGHVAVGVVGDLRAPPAQQRRTTRVTMKPHANAKTAKLWKERLQAASFFHNLPRDKQIAGLAAAAADKPKTPGGTEADTSRPLFDAYGNRLPQNPPKGLHFHNLPAEHTERERPQAAKGGGETAEVGAAESVKAVGGKGQATKASAYFRGPLKSFTIIGMEVCV